MSDASPISLASFEACLSALPFPAFLSPMMTPQSPVCFNTPLATALGQDAPEVLDLDALITFERNPAPTWMKLIQTILPTSVLCRTADNERMKLSLYLMRLEEKPYVMGTLASFQEDVALTQAHHDFVSIMSHEFRTPLTSIRGFADTMLQYGEKLDFSQRSRFIKIIREQADRLARMVENVLIMSKLGQEQKAPKPQPVALKNVIQKVEAALQGKGVAVDSRYVYQMADDIDSVWAEPDGLLQILLNLMDNSAKYSPATKQIRVHVGRCPNEPKRKAKISITDQGEGMTPEQQEKLFSKFYRTSNHMTQEVEGSGLGLYITKSLVHRLDGDIGVDSETGKGSTFWFTVPLNTLEHQDKHRSSIALGGASATEGGSD
jgi:signal transduction histidine kinase